MAERLLIVPRGNSITMGKSPTPGTASNLIDAVQGGPNYLGICAGGLLAEAGPHNHLDLTSGVRFGYYAVVNQGIHKAAVAFTGVGSPALEHYWEDGPQFSGWGAVFGKYPDGTPAFVEEASGKAWVVLSGVNPEAPESWRRGMTFTTPASTDNAYARTSLPHFLGTGRSGTDFKAWTGFLSRMWGRLCKPEACQPLAGG